LVESHATTGASSGIASRTNSARSGGERFNAATFAFPALTIELEGVVRDILTEEADLAAEYQKAKKKNGSFPNAARFLARQLNAEVDRS
jgi:hypothetical protein